MLWGRTPSPNACRCGLVEERRGSTRVEDYFCFSGFRQVDGLQALCINTASGAVAEYLLLLADAKRSSFLVLSTNTNCTYSCVMRSVCFS